MIKKLVAAFFVLLPLPAASATLPIVGGITTVEVTANLGALGLFGAPFLEADVDVSDTNPLFSFGITGGSTNGDTLIEHDGSGVTLASIADPSINTTVSNFLIDVGAGGIFGNVDNSADQALLFTFDPLDAGAPDIPIFIAAPLAGQLTTIFDAPDLATAQFGIANTSPEIGPAVVPLPAGLPLMVAGLGALWVVRRRTGHKRKIAA